MAIRTGMQNLVNRVRALTSAGTAEYVAGTLTYWTDDHLEDVLDRNSRFFVDAPLNWQQQMIGGTAVYYTAFTPYRDLEELASGTARWEVRTGPGISIGTAGYTPDYQNGIITFTASQGGSAYYLTGWTYDVYAAAADVWVERLAHFQDWYDFRADNQTFSRSQAFKNAEKMEAYLRKKAGSNLVQNHGDLRVSQFVRTDLGDNCYPRWW